MSDRSRSVSRGRSRTPKSEVVDDCRRRRSVSGRRRGHDVDGSSSSEPSGSPRSRAGGDKAERRRSVCLVSEPVKVPSVSGRRRKLDVDASSSSESSGSPRSRAGVDSSGGDVESRRQTFPTVSDRSRSGSRIRSPRPRAGGRSSGGSARSRRQTGGKRSRFLAAGPPELSRSQARRDKSGGRKENRKERGKKGSGFLVRSHSRPSQPPVGRDKDVGGAEVRRQRSKGSSGRRTEETDLVSECGDEHLAIGLSQSSRGQILESGTISPLPSTSGVTLVRHSQHQPTLGRNLSSSSSAEDSDSPPAIPVDEVFFVAEDGDVPPATSKDGRFLAFPPSAPVKKVAPQVSHSPVSGSSPAVPTVSIPAGLGFPEFEEFMKSIPRKAKSMYH